MSIAQQQPDIAPKTRSTMETGSDKLQTSSYAANLALTRGAYRLRLAESREDPESAFRLRYLVFNLESMRAWSLLTKRGTTLTNLTRPAIT